jgi:hypothetical protein
MIMALAEGSPFQACRQRHGAGSSGGDRFKEWRLVVETVARDRLKHCQLKAAYARQPPCFDFLGCASGGSGAFVPSGNSSRTPSCLPSICVLRPGLYQSI